MREAERQLVAAEERREALVREREAEATRKASAITETARHEAKELGRKQHARLRGSSRRPLKSNLNSWRSSNASVRRWRKRGSSSRLHRRGTRTARRRAGNGRRGLERSPAVGGLTIDDIDRPVQLVPARKREWSTATRTTCVPSLRMPTLCPGAVWNPLGVQAPRGFESHPRPVSQTVLESSVPACEPTNRVVGTGATEPVERSDPADPSAGCQSTR